MPRQRKPSGRRSEFGTPRSLQDFSRRTGGKPPRKVLTIICEGIRTEPEYFGELRKKHRLSTLDIQIVKGQGAPQRIVEEGITHQKSAEVGDEVWCVFDTENKANNLRFDAAIDQARKAPVFLAVSNPAFEYWCLLHFESTDRPFHDANDALNALRVHIPQYDKHAPFFHELEGRIPDALRNAQKLRQNSIEPWDEFPNPSTGVDGLVRSIMGMVDEAC